MMYAVLPKTPIELMAVSVRDMTGQTVLVRMFESDRIPSSLSMVLPPGTGIGSRGGWISTSTIPGRSSLVIRG